MSDCVHNNRDIGTLTNSKNQRKYQMVNNLDDFYDDDEKHEEGRRFCHQVCHELYNNLLSELELLVPN